LYYIHYTEAIKIYNFKINNGTSITIMTTVVTLFPNNYILLIDYFAVTVLNPNSNGNVIVIITIFVEIIKISELRQRK